MRIFLDLDETLINTESLPASLNIIPIIGGDVKTINLAEVDYNVSKRPFVQDFIEWCRKLVGNDNVYIYTAAVYTYAKKINDVHKLGFRDDQIFTCYDGKLPIDVHSTANLLIDNESLMYCRFKLENLGLNSRFLKIRPWHGIEHGDEQKYLLKFRSYVLEEFEEI